MTKLKQTMIAVAVLLASITAAHAGSNTCEGTVTVGKDWTTVKGDVGDYAPDGCRFLTASKLGRRILAACPDGTADCAIDVPLNKRSSTITSITNVEAIKPPQARVVDEAAVRKLCPDPNARCKARDNPDFYKDSDPDFYNRITKPAGKP
jgi:hypothetical protein